MSCRITHANQISKTSGAFHFLGAGGLHRIDDLATKYYPLYWTTMATNWLRQHGRSVDVHLADFRYAVCVIGDTPYQLPDAMNGVIATFGVNVGTKSALRDPSGFIVKRGSWPATNQWLCVLETNTPRPPVPPPRLPPASPAKVIQSNIPTAMREQGLY